MSNYAKMPRGELSRREVLRHIVQPGPWEARLIRPAVPGRIAVAPLIQIPVAVGSTTWADAADHTRTFGNFALGGIDWDLNIFAIGDFGDMNLSQIPGTYAATLKIELLDAGGATLKWASATNNWTLSNPGGGTFSLTLNSLTTANDGTGFRAGTFNGVKSTLTGTAPSILPAINIFYSLEFLRKRICKP